MDGSPLRVLLIEDDDDSRSLFAEVLEEARMQVVSASHDVLPAPDGYGIVVTDLPGREGYSNGSAMAWVDELKKRFAVPVVVLTGRDEAAHDDVLRSAATLLSKPLDIDDLVATVRKAAQI